MRPAGEDPDREGAGTTKDRDTETDRDRQGKEQGMTFHKGTEAQKGK